MEFLYLLEKIRIPVLNEFMLLITRLGEETAFLVIALVLFWCVSKQWGYYLLSVGFIGTLANQFMKLLFQVPRPWVLDPGFSILEQAREAASGYSFPSGHTQSSVGTFGSLAYLTKNKWIRIGSIFAVILVPFSRMYIGVHTPMDVLVAAAMAVVLIIALKPVVLPNKKKTMLFLFGVMMLLAISFLCFVECYPFSTKIDHHNLESGIKNAYTLTGALLGLFVVYLVDERYLQFPTNAVWWVQIIKVAVGLLLVLAVKSGLKSPLNMVFGESIGRAVRYFMIVIVAGVVWPLSFRKLSMIGNNVCDTMETEE